MYIYISKRSMKVRGSLGVQSDHEDHIILSFRRND